MRTHRRVYEDAKREAKARLKYEKAIEDAYALLFSVTAPAEEACEDAVWRARKQYEVDAGPFRMVPIRKKRW
jgi:hypothetical protein